MSGPTGTFTEESLRKYLRLRLEVQHCHSPETVLIDELGIRQGSARVDVAVVNGQLHGYEIKSDRDSLRRLSSQADLYNQVFDRLTLVCADRHVSQALRIIPSWWEVIKVVPTDDCPTFTVVRRGHKNPHKDVRALVELLWRQEAVALLRERHALRGLRGKPRASLWNRVCELFTIDEVSVAVRTHLKATAELRGRSALQ